MKRNSTRGPSFCVFLPAALLFCGCAPIYYGPPPTAPPGSLPLQQGTPTPVNPGVPPTFQNGGNWGPTGPGSAATDMNDVQEVPANQALQLPPKPEESDWYEVKDGEGLEDIAKQHGVTVEQLMKENFFETMPNLKAGQLIIIP